MAFAVVVFSLLLTACTGESHKTIEPVPVDVELVRLDHAVFRTAPDSMAGTCLRMQAELGPFWQLYVEDILQAAALDDPRLPLALNTFTSDPDWMEAQAAIDSVFGDLSIQRADMQQAFGRLKAVFPDSITPRVIVFNSGFNYGLYPTDSDLGIGAEWFIGPEQKVISYLAPESFPQYVKDRMRPDMLAPGAVKGWLMVHWLRDVRGEDLLTNLVEVGKVMVLLEMVMPDTDPLLRFAFTSEQLKWCEGNEYMMWQKIVNDELLFSKEEKAVGRILNDAPFTNGFPRESPGHVGEWIGYRMVQAYMADNPDLTFAQLFALTDAKEILKTYKPR
ncbi:MAG: hypothetical protein WAU70_07425 [Flavobacteriales bacterium]